MTTPKHIQDVTLILAGTGNLAWQYPRLLAEGGLRFAYVWGRNQDETLALAKYAGAFPVLDAAELPNTEHTLLFLAVSDVAIANLAKQFAAPNRWIVHSSGATASDLPDMDGVFYPLQTFSKQHHPPLADIPFFVTSKDENLQQVLISLGNVINGKVQVINDWQRLHLHLAAVITANFSNHLMHLAQNLLIEQGLHAPDLLPLMKETLAKWYDMPAAQAQTGPAWRGDLPVIEKHLKLLENNPALQRVYAIITQSIQEQKHRD